MLPEQLDLFGGPPKPPKRIRVEEPAPKPAEQEAALSQPLPAEEVVAAVADTDPVESSLSADEMPDWVTDNHEEETATAELDETHPESEPSLQETAGSSAAVVSPVSDVIAYLEPEEPLDDAEAAAADAAAGEVGGQEGGGFDYPTSKLQVEPISEEAILIVQVKNEKQKARTSNEDVSPDGLNIPPDEILFQRQYYTMRETSDMFSISHSMLRYWENEFEVLQPRKNRKGDRYFRPVDIKNLQLIYNLLKVRKFTIEGAKEYLRKHNKALDTFELIQKLEKMKLFLQELKAHL